MSPISLHSDGNYRQLIMHNEGKFNRNSLDAFNASLTEVAADLSAQALLISGEGKYFAQGLDLEYLGSITPDDAMGFVEECMHMIGRLLQFPLPVVAAVNGHAFGLGAMITLAADYKVMRADRGYFCLPEVDLNMVLVPCMNALVTHTLTAANLRDTLLTGSRIGGTEACQRGIVDEACSEEALITRAQALAAPMMGKNRDTLAGLKRGIHFPVISAIDATKK
jgi:enoyl-CoA hydratase/carnithine racemase